MVLLTRKRIIAAYTVAVAADALQLILGPVGWMLPDETLDIVAMIVESWLLGFHVLLLPTFVLEMFPIADMLPTWTGCVALVIAMRKRQQQIEPPPPADGAVIDV